MEYSKLGLEHFSPEHIDYFYNLKNDTKSKLISEQDLLYKGISAKTISDIYDVLYENDLKNNKSNINLITNSSLTNAYTCDDKLDCYFHHSYQEKDFLIRTNRVIAATGYKYDIQPALKNIEWCIDRDINGNLDITHDYRVKTKNTKLTIFVQNAEILSHGVGTPDLGLGSYRNAIIVNQLLKDEVYKLSQNNVFADFGVPQKYQIKNDYNNLMSA
jgi:lysine N6-hydroxylase